VDAERLKEQENNNLKRLLAELQAAGGKRESRIPQPEASCACTSSPWAANTGLAASCDAFCCMAALLIELAQLPWRFDYCGLYALLKLEFPAMKHKKVYRLYQEANLSGRRRRVAGRASARSEGAHRMLL
jgi:hypothetical protein